MEKAGFKAWVSQNALDYVGERIASFIDDSITNANFPAVTGNKYGFYFKLQHVKASLSADVKASPVPGVGFRCRIFNWELHLEGDLLASLGPAWTQGQVVVTSDPGATFVDYVIAMGTTDSGRPEMWVENVETGYGLASAKFKGSLLSGLTEFVSWIGKSLINNAVMGLMKTIVETIVCDGVVSELSSMPLQMSLPLPAPFDVAAINIGVASIDPTEDAIAIGIDGGIVDISGTDIKYPGSPADLVTDQLNTERYVSAAVTQWLPNSLLYLLKEKNLLSFTVTPDMIPADSPVGLSTSTFMLWLPQLWLNYGHRNMSVEISAAEAPTANIEYGYVKASVRCLLKFSVQTTDGWEEIFTTSSGMDLGVSTWIEQPKWKDESLLQENGTCFKDTGGTCSVSQCDASRDAVCRDGACLCPDGYCATGGRCVPETTQAPMPTPRPAEPPQVVRWYTKKLEVHDFKVVDSKVGYIPHECFNWIMNLLLPCIEDLINLGEGYFGVPLNTSSLPLRLKESSVEYKDREVRAYTDFDVSAMYQPLGQMLFDLISSKIQMKIDDLVAEY